MSDVVIRVENLSKQYKIGVAKRRHDTIRDHLTEGFKSFFRRNGRRLASGIRESAASGTRSPFTHDETIWALKDISFEVKQGEVIGIIGRNGAGKSTLLKILSRITEPTSGFAEIHGRVASLLEVGTGFHGELTGRENIYLNGAILGMKKAEIDRKFDEIVAFSEVEKFTDTPVKRYSSGMYVRLAFAVAAHLEPEILIVDEVLAVGDAAFQKKCLGKMDDVAKEGRTVLFVSHNMASVEHLCQKAVVLEKGKLAFTSGSREAINHYLNRMADDSLVSRSHIVDLENTVGRPPEYRPMLTSLELYTEPNIPLVNGCLRLGAPLQVYVSFGLETRAANLDVTLTFENNLGQCILLISSLFQTDPPTGNRVGNRTLVCDIPSFTLLPGEYKINAFIDIAGVNVDRVMDAARITVVESDYYGSGRLPDYGFLVLNHRWYDRAQ